uniref:Uncharacterized protein n=1 Tax=Meloidogyne floridensis TaxID=298350 RepID=A0A915NSW8_9BILA
MRDFWTSPKAFQNNSTHYQLPSNDYSCSSCTRSQCHSPASSSLRSGPLPAIPALQQQQQPPKMGTFITQQTEVPRNLGIFVKFNLRM